jgi:hypothetical protein
MNDKDQNIKISDKSNQSITLKVRVLFFFISMVPAWFVFKMLESGETISRSDGYLRDDNPLMFWLYITFVSVLSVTSFLFSIWPSKDNADLGKQ